MKTIFAAVLIMVGVSANAGILPDRIKPNYFRFVGPGNYHVYDGALFSAKGLSGTQNATVLALVTHSPADGSLLPPAWTNAGYAETWAPLVIGGCYGNGQASLNPGTLINIGPQLQAALLNGMNYLAPDAFPNAKTFLINQAKPGATDITFAFGILPSAQVIQHGTFMPFNKWWGDPVRYYAGPALHF